MIRADLEEEQRQQRIRDGHDPDPDLAPKAARRSSGVGEDGSFSRPGTSCLSLPELKDNAWEFRRDLPATMTSCIFSEHGKSSVARMATHGQGA